MDVLDLARLQFAVTTVYHFFFVPLTLGLGLLIAIIETLYVRTGNDVYKRMAKFWGILFIINFGMGVATGLVQEFQFGMNWSDYSRFVGDVFGAPLAVEALLAFFLESTFLGLWLFGWDKLPKKIHLASIWMVVFGSYMSAFWILVASSFMHEPVGFAIRNGRAEMTDFLAIITNTHLWFQFPHVLMGGWVTGSFFMLGISAFHLLKNSKSEFYLKSAKVASIVALASSLLVGATGHLQAQHIVEAQPMKMAAAEALWETENPAGFSLVALINEQSHSNQFAIRVPYMLSFLAHDNIRGEVKGINELQGQYEKQYGPGNYVPQVNVVFWSFRVMVGAGMAMIALAMGSVFFLFKKGVEKGRYLLMALPFAIALPYIANSAGWIMTEMGRQPWAVVGLLKTEQAVSPTVSFVSVLISLVIFTALYGALAVADVYLLAKHARKHQSDTEPVIEQSTPEEEKVLVGAY